MRSRHFLIVWFLQISSTVPRSLRAAEGHSRVAGGCKHAETPPRAVLPYRPCSPKRISPQNCVELKNSCCVRRPSRELSRLRTPLRRVVIPVEPPSGMLAWNQASLRKARAGVQDDLPSPKEKSANTRITPKKHTMKIFRLTRAKPKSTCAPGTARKAKGRT